MRSELSPDWDAIVIGSGLQVLMLERERVTRLRHDGLRVTAVEAFDRRTGEPRRFQAETVVLAAGALASSELIVASGLEQLNPAGDLVATLRMGVDARTSALDPTGRFRGLENLYVIDASGTRGVD